MSMLMLFAHVLEKLSRTFVRIASFRVAGMTWISVSGRIGRYRILIRKFSLIAGSQLPNQEILTKSLTGFGFEWTKLKLLGARTSCSKYTFVVKSYE
jgi:hypothetical protein